MPTERQYHEFANEMEALADPLRVSLPAITVQPRTVREFGRPGIVLSGQRAIMARLPFPLFILIRWSDAAIEEYLGADADARAQMRASFGGNLPVILRNIDRGHGGVDWEGKSQASAHGLVVDLDEF